MSLFSKLVGAATSLIPGGGIVKAAVKLAAPAASSIFKSKAGRAVVTTGGIAAAGLGVAKVTSGGSTISSPVGTLPSLGSVAAGQTSAIQSSGAGGLPVPFWKGAGGKLQMPWNDPRIPEYLKSFALDDAYLKTYVRAPRGYVIVRDANGRAFAVNKAIARQFGLWHPAAKPPISATDYKHFKRNKQIEKKLKKIAGPLVRKHTVAEKHSKKR